jgi:hypothetical protein
VAWTSCLPSMKMAQESAAYLPQPGSLCTSSAVLGGESSQAFARRMRERDRRRHRPRGCMAGWRSISRATARMRGCTYRARSHSKAGLACVQVVRLTREQATSIQNGSSSSRSWNSRPSEGALGPAGLDRPPTLILAEHAEVALIDWDAELSGEPLVGAGPGGEPLAPVAGIELPVDVEGAVGLVAEVGELTARQGLEPSPLGFPWLAEPLAHATSNPLDTPGRGAWPSPRRC